MKNEDIKNQPRNFFSEWSQREKDEQERGKILKEITASAAFALGKGIGLIK